MARYKVSERTRERILAAARSLFYEKGYCATAYGEICRLAGVNEGTLHYQYKSKANLGAEIRQEAVLRNLEEARRLCPAGEADDGSLLFCLFNCVYWYKFFADERYARFSCEAAAEIAMDDTERYLTEYFPEALFDFDADKASIRLNAVTCFSMDRGMPIYLRRHMQEHSWQQVVRHCVGLYAQLLAADASRLTDALERAIARMETSDLSGLCTRLEEAAADQV